MPYSEKELLCSGFELAHVRAERKRGELTMKYIKYREAKEHGTFDFPMEFYHVGPAHPRYEMSYHWHIEYEVIRVLKGELLMTIGEDEFTAKSGDIIFIKGGLLHGGIPKNCLYECIVYNLDSLMTASPAGERLLKKVSSNSIEIYDHFPSGDRELLRITDRMFGYMKTRAEGHELTVIGAFYEFFGYILEHSLYKEAQSISAKDGQRIEHLKNVIATIEEHYDECITLDDLARAAGMNSKYFCRYFREMTHRTPIDYLNYYRVEQACFKLATTNDSVAEIGMSCGFNDESYFIKTFKKYKGVTPKKYLSTPLVS